MTKAEMMDSLERAKILLKATKDLFEKQENSYYVLNLLAETVFYDGAECDGSCLKDDIDDWFYEVEAQSVTPTQKWISCSDRLPKENEHVLVCDSQGTMRVCYYHIDDTFYPTEYADLNETGWYDEVDDALYFEPIAWMPLPEPYNAEMESGE